MEFDTPEEQPSENGHRPGELFTRHSVDELGEVEMLFDPGEIIVFNSAATWEEPLRRHISGDFGINKIHADVFHRAIKRGSGGVESIYYIEDDVVIVSTDLALKQTQIR